MRYLTHSRRDHTRLIIAFGNADTAFVRVRWKIANHAGSVIGIDSLDSYLIMKYLDIKVTK